MFVVTVLSRAIIPNRILFFIDFLLRSLRKEETSQRFTQSTHLSCCTLYLIQSRDIYKVDEQISDLD